MSHPFLHPDFLLRTVTARHLFHEVAAGLPVIDFHNHLSANQIADDIRFANLTRIWLEGDHYKWRAMRACAVDERLITGDADDLTKFRAWASTVPLTVRNPLHHWTHMELGIFGITDRLLNPATADGIWDEANAQLATEAFSARNLIRRHNVAVVGTTDDPADSLEHHHRLAEDSSAGFRLVPTLRPDKGMEVGSPGLFREWIGRMEAVTGRSITTYRDLLEALSVRYDAFSAAGCRASDHGLDEPYSEPFTDSDVERIFAMAMRGQVPGDSDIRLYRSAYLYHCGVFAHARGWVFQLHIGALRNVNTRMKAAIGNDSGFDAIGDPPIARNLAGMLDRLDQEDRLPRTILYNLNPRDNELFSAMAGCFQTGRIPGKVQHGPAWWFSDQLDGMRRHVESVSALGLLSQFVGMTTDSRSLLSWPRHAYYRRHVCDMIGTDVEEGRIPDDDGLLRDLIERLCHRNAAAFFRFDQPA